MSIYLPRRTVLVGMGALAAASALPSMVSAATTHEIQMLNRHPDDSKRKNVFLPVIQTIEAGDTITWIPTEKGHNSQSAKGMLPDGVDAWKSRINKEFSLTLDKPGVYGYQCTPHVALGMVGLIIVRGDGMMDNVEAARAVKHRGRAKKSWEAIWAQVDADSMLAV